MNDKDKLKNLTIDINEFLSVYIQIHNKINREAETFISVIKNLFGQGVPMSKLVDIAKSLTPICDSLKVRIDSFKIISYSNLSNDEKHYFDILSNYFNSLEKTVNCLIEKQLLSNIKSKGLSKKSISFREFILKEKEYKSKVNEYSAIGRQLNNVSYIIFS